MKLKIGIFYIFASLVFSPSVMAQNKITIGTFDVPTAVVKANILLKRAYKKIGIEMKLARFPALRALAVANDGIQSDGELIRIAGLSKEYPNIIQIPVKIADFKISVFTIETNFKVNGWPSLKPYEIAFMRGFKGMEKYSEGLKVYRVSSQEAALIMLIKNRTEIAVLPYLDGLVLRKELMLNEIKILSPALEKVKLFHYLHKKNKHLVPKITEILEIMKKNGEIDKFWEKLEEELTNI